MEYAEFVPAEPLRGLIRCYWQLRGDGSAGNAADPALPDGSPELIVNLGEPFEHVGAGGTTTVQPRAFLVGQITRPMVVRPTGRVDIIAVRFEAHGAALLHDNLGALTESWVALDALRSGALAGLPLRLASATSMADATAILDETLLAAVHDFPSPDSRVAEAVARIRRVAAGESLERIAGDVGLTARSLQRLFSRQVGISPKLLARIVRFQRVFAAARDEPGSLARVAIECGYFDQSHLVRDFRDFAGSPPAALLAALPEFTAFFTA